MANRRLFQFNYSYERDLVHIHAKIAIGASGAPTLNAPLSKGILSIVRNSAGDYTIRLTDSFNQLMMVDMLMQNATGIPAAPDMGLKANSVNSATVPSIEIVTSAAGVATDPASGDTMFLHLVCRNAST